MATVTKKELIDRLAATFKERRAHIKRIIQQFLDEIVRDLGKGNRLEFRDFGVFESKIRKPRKAQNPKTLEPINVPAKRTVKFKVGRLMRAKLSRSVPSGASSGLSAEESRPAPQLAKTASNHEELPPRKK